MKFKGIDRIAIIFFVLVVGVFFHQTIFQGKLPVPSDTLVGLYHPWRDLYNGEYPRGIPYKNFLITDPVRQQIPWRKIAIDKWKEGKISLWNPYNFSGAPLLANIQAAALYPLNTLFLVNPFIDAWTMLIILQPLLAGLFMYWYLRSLDIQPVAGLLGAIVWSFSGFNVAWLTWGTIGHVALWLPLALLSVDKLFQTHLTTTRNIVWSIVFVLSLIFQFFAGHTQISLYFMLMVVGYGTTRILQAKDRRKVMLLFIALLSFVALFTAVQWMPLLDWVRQSGRVIDLTDWHKEGWFIPWAHLVQFVAPDFFGNPTTLNYWGQWNYGELVGYVGILPLVFAFIAVISPTLKAHRVWIGVVSIALFFALPTPIATLPFILKFPIFSSLQPTRLLFVVDFSLAVLAAYGCHEFLKSPKRRDWVWSVGILGVILAILWGVAIVGSLDVSKRNLVVPTVIFFVGIVLLIIYTRAHRVIKFGNVLAWSFVAFVIVDLFRFGWKFTPFTPREHFFPETKTISFLKEQTQPYRVMSVDKRILPPNTGSYFGIESIEGYDPIISSRYEELLAAVARGKPDIAPPFGFNRILSVESIDSSILPILGAQYILSLSDLKEPYLKKVFEEGETRVYEDYRAVPRVYVVERPIVVFGKEKAIEALYAIKDVRREAVVEGNISVLAVPMESNESIQIMRYESHQLEIDTKLSVPRLLVVANAYDPGWRATVDGKKTSIYRTNYAFEGIVVPAGTHKVEFLY